MSTFGTLQSSYCSKFGLSGRYTPQIVINGLEQNNGANNLWIRGKIDNFLVQTIKAGVAIKLVSDPNDQPIRVAYNILDAPAGSKLKVFLLEGDLTSVVTAGENTGKTLHHENVARTLRIMNIYEPVGEVKIMVPTGVVRNNVKIMAYVQDATSLEIIAATKGFDLFD